MMKDKREECGCHKGCTMLPHECEKPCSWPKCLTEEEAKQLADECYAALTTD
jgi:hypothetical protein